MARQKWKVGDIFLLPRKDGMFILGQIVGQERQVLNSVSVAIYATPCLGEDDARQLELDPSALISTVFTTRDLLDNGTWKVVRCLPVTMPSGLLPYEHLRASGYVGARIYGSANVTKLANAYFALEPWDGFFEPDYLDKMLVSLTRKPKHLLLTKPQTG